MKHTLRRPLVPLTLAMTLALSLSMSACSQDEPAAFEETQTQTTAAAQEDAEPASETEGTAEPATDEGTVDDATPSEDVTQASAAAAGVDLTDVEPLATAIVPAIVEGDADATMEVALLGLRRDGKVLVGTYSFTVTSDAPNPEPQHLYRYLGRQSWRPYLVDTVNLTRHDVLGNGSAQTESVGPSFLPGQTLYAYAMFAAPAEDVTQMSVSLVDSAPAVTGVPVQ